jgi:tRNA nucleotidyltransferase (CCA-adding enzyme)
MAQSWCPSSIKLVQQYQPSSSPYFIPYREGRVNISIQITIRIAEGARRVLECPRNDIEKKVLELIVPRSEDYKRLRRIVDKAKNLIISILEEFGIRDALVTAEGSFAKDTWLRGDVDIDLFILLPHENCLSIINQGLVAWIESSLKNMGYHVEKRYAQHPYLRLLYSGIWIEIVPGCRVKDPSKPITAVDRTPYHREFVLKNTSPEQRNEIRLLKSFLKGIGVYGAEIAVQGFSGYLAELLIIKYKCFRSLLDNASKKWKPRLVITLSEKEKQHVDRLLEIYSNAPLIFPDPVDPKRNVAAALSYKSFSLFITAAKMYLRNPRYEFFHVFTPHKTPYPGQIGAKAADRIDHTVLIVLTPPEKEAPDNLWGIVKRVARIITRILESNGFIVDDYSVYAKEDGTRAYISVEIENPVLPSYELRRGPPAWAGENAERFLQKHLSSEDTIGPWIDDAGRLVALKKRRYRRPEELLASTIRDLLPKAAKNYTIRVGKALALIENLDRDELAWLEKFVEKTPHWMKPYR